MLDPLHSPHPQCHSENPTLRDGGDALEVTKITCEQVSAIQHGDQVYEQFSKQLPVDMGGKYPTSPAHIHVKQRISGKRKQADRRTGGYRTTKCLTHDEYRSAKDGANAIVNAGYRWSILLSIRPQEHLTDRQKQNRIQKVLSRFGEAIKRRGLPYISMRTYEKKREVGSLHGHALIYVPKEHLDIVKRIADLFEPFDKKYNCEAGSIEIHAEVIGKTQDDLRNAILYVLKEHQWAGPGNDGAGSRRKFYEKGAPIKGRRISFSKDAKDILSLYQASLPKLEAVPDLSHQEQPTVDNSIKVYSSHAENNFMCMNLVAHTYAKCIPCKANKSTMDYDAPRFVDDQKALDCAEYAETLLDEHMVERDGTVKPPLNKPE